MSRRPRTWLLAVVLAAVTAPPAHAAITVDVTATAGLRISVTGTDSRLTVQPSTDGPALLVRETENRALTAGSGCVNADATLASGFRQVRCDVPAIRFVTFLGGTGADRLTLANTVGDCQCNGAGGADTITGADGVDLINGGEGADVLNGGPNVDRIGGGGGEDTLLGGDDNDELTGDGDGDALTGGWVPGPPSARCG